MGGAVDAIVERCAGIDIGKASLKTTVRVQGGQGRRTRREVRTFGTTTPELLRLRDWLADERVSVVGMESTGVFWKPIVRHEARGIEWRCKDFTAGQSQLAGEAGGSRDVGTHATVGAALTTYGTGRHCQTVRVRQAVMRRRTRGTAV
jgi:hypothetical protein